MTHAALKVTAHVDPLGGPLSLPDGYLHLDSLLAWAVCLRDGVRPALTEEEVIPIEIPVAREPGGRFHLASVLRGDWELMEKKFLNRRFPVEQAAVMSTMRKVEIARGAQKSYRIPMEAGRFRGDQLSGYVLGDRDGIIALLSLVGYLGKRRAVGCGKVARWSVEPCTAWPGFPVQGPDGRALRHLPLGWPGLPPEPPARYGCLTYPYWLHSREVPVAVPA